MDHPRLGKVSTPELGIIFFILVIGWNDTSTPELGDNGVQIYVSSCFLDRLAYLPQSWGTIVCVDSFYIVKGIDRHIYPRVGESCVTDISCNIPN